jgi:hypothetical protein
VYYFGKLKNKTERSEAHPLGSILQLPLNNASQGDSLPGLEGIVLGAMLGRGSYGSVHVADWQGQKVAVKVRAERQCTFPKHGTRRGSKGIYFL